MPRYKNIKEEIQRERENRTTGASWGQQTLHTQGHMQTPPPPPIIYQSPQPLHMSATLFSTSATLCLHVVTENILCK